MFVFCVYAKLFPSLNHLFLKHSNAITSNLLNNKHYLKCSVIAATHNYPEFHLKENKQTSMWVNRSICLLLDLIHPLVWTLSCSVYTFYPKQLTFYQKPRYFSFPAVKFTNYTVFTGSTINILKLFKRVCFLNILLFRPVLN